jgi:hypothetical protein
VKRGPAFAGENSKAVLADWGFDQTSIEGLCASGAVKQR